MIESRDPFRPSTSRDRHHASTFRKPVTMSAEHSRRAAQRAALADHLAGRHDAVIAAWHAEVEADPGLETASSLSLNHFRNRIPEILASFEAALRGSPEAPVSRDSERRFSEHAMHRMQQGYSLREMVQEWQHLQICVLRELEGYAWIAVDLEPDVLPAARETWALHGGAALAEIVGEYVELEQAEAESRLLDLEQALVEVREIERRRAEAWHEAAHDLRGNVGVVTTTTAILAEAEAPVVLRSKALHALQRGVAALQQLLEDLMSLARLESGREQPAVEAFDAAALLREMCASLQPLAVERGLSLRCHGPETLVVQSDPAKVRRIVQNLVLNALKYTGAGGVVVTWGETRESDTDRWLIRIEDTGPGLDAAADTPLGRKLQEATRESRALEDERGDPNVEPIPRGDAPSAASPLQRPGEGIGLSIVKRLCELLEAGLEIASTADGTTIQLVIPRRHSKSPSW
jgi:signal transduction histidine kinase